MMFKLINASRCITAIALCLNAAAFAQQAEQALDAEFPPQSIDTVERAKEALKQVPAVRTDIDRRVTLEKTDCYKRFFTTSCLDDLYIRERKSRKIVRRVEVEANALLRKDKAAQRDLAVAQREQRAAEQRAKAITITGTARESDGAEVPADVKPAANDPGR
jgi:hypothetical protein